MKIRRLEPHDDPESTGRHAAVQPKPKPARQVPCSFWKWMAVVYALIALLALLGCASKRQTETVGRQQFKGTVMVPIPSTQADGTLAAVPVPVTFDLTLDTSEVEEEIASASLDRDEVKAMIADGLKAGLAVAKMSPAGPAVEGTEKLLGWVLGGLGLAAAAGQSIKARKNGRAVLDAVEFGKEVVAMLPKEQADTVKDKHRDRQKKRGTNEVIKSHI